AQTRGLMLDLAQWSASGEWLGAVDTAELRDQRAGIFARTALDRLRRKVKRGGRDLANLDDEERHELRKDAKKLRYAAEFFAAQFDRKRQRRRYKRFIAALEALQEALGALNDLVTAPAVLSGLGIANSPGTMAVLFPGSHKTLLETAGEAHAALVDAGRFWR
ncbi:MAG TPA: CHAD domain-containing protein, partial [Sphingomonas sp.]|nr:CHAD domain-containing protein [Sphingomonas sp.]